MTTSGSIDFSLTRDNLIFYAYRRIGGVEEDGTLTTNQTTEGSILLNMIAKARQADGMPLWALKSGYILPQTGVSTINLNNSTGDHATNSYVQTTTSAAASSGASTIVVTSATGFANGYYIGIELSDSTMQWTTINGAPSGTTITLTAALTGDVASGAQVYCYQTKMQRPLRVLEAYIIDVAAQTRFPIRIVTRDQFKSLGSYLATSVPTQVYYDPQLVTGVLSIYPRFLTGDKLMEIVYHREFEDFDTSSDTPDFPQEWYLPLYLELAAILGPHYGVPIDERRALLQEAELYRELALSNGYPEGSLYFQVDQYAR